MNAIILDYRADSEIVFNLNKLGIDIIPSFQSLLVSEELSGHPDLQICKVDEGVFVCSAESYDYYKKALKKHKIHLICGDSVLDRNYPHDIAYNVARVGDIAIHNTTYTDLKIKKEFARLNIKVIHVNQGYSKCNVCVVSNNAIITSDAGIQSALEPTGIDILLIRQGYIDIFGWDHGFIGGATGKLDDSTLVFCGDISTHPDYENIVAFCRKHDVRCVSLSQKRLMDLGSVISV